MKRSRLNLKLKKETEITYNGRTVRSATLTPQTLTEVLQTAEARGAMIAAEDHNLNPKLVQYFCREARIES